MATRTISVAGGAANVAATYDENAVPTSSDTVVCRSDGTSGNWTVSANLSVQAVDMRNGSGYSATMTINGGVTLTIGTSTGFKYSDTMTCAGSGIILHSVTQSVTAGSSVGVPWEIRTTNGQVVTLTGTLISNNQWTYLSGGNTSGQWNGGTVQIRSSYWCDGRCSGTTVFLFTGGAGGHTVRGNSAASRNHSNPITWDTGANNYTVDTTTPHFGGNTLTYVSGTMHTLSILLAGTVTFSGAGWSTKLPSISNTTATSGVTFSAAAIDMADETISFSHNLTVSGATSLTLGDTTCLAAATLAHGAIPLNFNGNMDVRASLTLTGSGALNFNGGSVLNVRNGVVLTNASASAININAGSSIVAISGGLSTTLIRSGTSGTQTTINISASATDAFFAGARFTDVAVTGVAAYNYVLSSELGTTLVNTTGVAEFANYAGGGGGPVQSSHGWAG